MSASKKSSGSSVWKIELRPAASRSLAKLPGQAQQRIVDFLKKRVTQDPRRLGDALQGKLGGLWRYRVGDYRLICKIEDERITVIVIEIGHRREIYRD